MSQHNYDLITVGRSSIDLYSNDLGAAFPEITSFASYVGGCPTNIAVGTRRLGLRSLLFTAVGCDPVGDFILNFLRKEAVETRFIVRKAGTRTSAVVLGIEPPDRFPLVYYRDNCADINLTIEDACQLPLQEARALLVTGTGFSREPSRSATLFLMQRAKALGLTVFLDLDFRADQWQNSPAADVRAFGVTVRSLLHLTDIVFGTEEEIKAALLTSNSQVSITDSQVSAPTISGDLDGAIAALVGMGPQALVVKRGAHGSTVHLNNGKVVSAKPFQVEVCNVLGAGDAYASGFIYGYLSGWDWQKAARMGNATGAIVVTKHGCANFMPTQPETLEFVKLQGGLVEEELTCRP